MKNFIFSFLILFSSNLFAQSDNKFEFVISSDTNYVDLRYSDDAYFYLTKKGIDSCSCIVSYHSEIPYFNYKYIRLSDKKNVFEFNDTIKKYKFSEYYLNSKLIKVEYEYFTTIQVDTIGICCNKNNETEFINLGRLRRAKDGTYKEYYENGQLKVMGLYKSQYYAGTYKNGIWKYWDIKGNLTKEEEYKIEGYKEILVNEVKY